MPYNEKTIDQGDCFSPRPAPHLSVLGIVHLALEHEASALENARRRIRLWPCMCEELARVACRLRARAELRRHCRAVSATLERRERVVRDLDRAACVRSCLESARANHLARGQVVGEVSAPYAAAQHLHGHH